MVRLLTRREVLLPTPLAWAMIAVLFGAMFVVGVSRVHDFLAVEAPLGNADVLVVEGWLSESELAQALAIYRDGDYRKLLTSGGPIERWAELIGFSGYAELAADYFKRHGVPEDQVFAIPAPVSAQDRTFLSAVKVREWLKTNGLGPVSMDVVTSGTHARRTRYLYRAAIGPLGSIGVLAVEPSGYQQSTWWQSSSGVKAVLTEFISLSWTICCFRVPEVGSQEEHWGW